MNENPNTVGCTQYSDGKCLGCYTDNNLHLITDTGHCCPLNYIWNNGCEKKTGDTGMT